MSLALSDLHRQSNPKSTMSSQTPLKPSFEFSEYTNTPKVVRRPPTAESHGFSFFGHYDSASLLPLLTEFCTSHQTEGEVRGAIKDFLDHFDSKHHLPEHTNVWASLRLEGATDRWRITRPHQDGSYWDSDLDLNGPDGVLPFKVGTVFAGPGTLFWDLPHCTEAISVAAQKLISTGMYERIRAVEANTLDPEIREWAHAELEKLGVGIVRVRPGQAVRWIVGNKEYAGIHSEPDLSELPDGRVL